MSWYVAELIVSCRIGKSPKGRTLYDRQVKVLRASTHEAAYQKALKLGKEENHSYKNAAGENLEVLQDKEISDGTEIYSRLQRGHPESEICRKHDLTIFWSERNKHKTAGELRNSVIEPFAPR